MDFKAAHVEQVCVQLRTKLVSAVQAYGSLRLDPPFGHFVDWLGEPENHRLLERLQQAQRTQYYLYEDEYVKVLSRHLESGEGLNTPSKNLLEHLRSNMERMCPEVYGKVATKSPDKGSSGPNSLAGM